MRAEAIFLQNNGDVTKAFYAEMNGYGPAGQVAVALFRAQKRSRAAKRYRRGQFTRAAYDVKNWSLGEVCRILGVHGDKLGIAWGWQSDPKAKGYENVLYVDLPTGQCSFHSPERFAGPDYRGKWSGRHDSAEIILAFCDGVMIEDRIKPPIEAT